MLGIGGFGNVVGICVFGIEGMFGNVDGIWAFGIVGKGAFGRGGSVTLGRVGI